MSLNALHFPMPWLEAFGHYLCHDWEITSRQSLIADRSFYLFILVRIFLIVWSTKGTWLPSLLKQKSIDFSGVWLPRRTNILKPPPVWQRSEVLGWE